ncbi:MAG TPA: hypothetical protein VEV87_01465 [Chitinophagaceae bacterium]|nr:hypothetical protein [Chitinophagaceae bacterium]
MRILKSSLVLLMATTSLTLRGQSVDEVINKHIEAIGGKDAISKVKSMQIESEVSVMGQALNSVTSILVNKGFKNVTTFNGVEIIQCFTPDGGWSVNPMMGSTTPTPVSEDQKKAGSTTFDVGGPLFNYKEKGSTAELAGSDSVNGVKTIKLKVKDKNAIETVLYLDPTSYYVLKQDSKGTVDGQEVVSTSLFSGYKKTDSGLVMPFITNTSNQGFEITITHNKIEFNKEIDPKIFEMPKS